MKFELSDEQMQRIRAWEAEQDKIWREKQLKSEDGFVRDQAATGPYYGAIGGSLTYTFTPTSLGVVIKIIHADREVLDISDYDNW